MASIDAVLYDQLLNNSIWGMESETRQKMQTEFTVVYLFGGIGGGALGFNASRGHYKGEVGQFRTLCSIDADPVATRNYERITNSPGKGVVMDLFSKKQYCDFHGVDEPPADWREVQVRDLWEAMGEEVPNVVLSSPPCKGYSPLLSESNSQSKKYQALNHLTLRGIRLLLDACEHYGDDLPNIIALENVPRIKTRGKEILKQIVDLLRARGYAISGYDHDLGLTGGLGQIRKRYLLLARLERKMSAFIFKPEQKRHLAIRDVLSKLPPPGDTANGGRLHRLPDLSFKTWVRLALIQQGGDWRDLNEVEWWNYRLERIDRVIGDKLVQPISCPTYNLSNNGKANIMRVMKVDAPASCVTGSVGPTNGAACIAEPLRDGVSYRDVFHLVDSSQLANGQTVVPNEGLCAEFENLALSCNPRTGTMGVLDSRKPAKTVVGNSDIHASASAVGDDWTLFDLCEAGADFPLDDDRGIFVVIAPDGTWHRPMTVLELAMIQSFDLILANGEVFDLVDCSDARAREYIGNAIPKLAAKQIGNVLLDALMTSSVGEFTMGFEEIWVMPDDSDDRVYDVLMQ
ncbi:DNA cytosine methyltransferase [Paenibacillus sp. GXUN7292]|uniref:DNA cytosine methyltransferase n=1 Tax=Paenibacillus sp. GXUN7292 TaxID=3422499 RepID=UPI003D7EDD0A